MVSVTNDICQLVIIIVPMRSKKVIYLNIAFVLLLFLSVAFIDKPLASFIATYLAFAKSFFYSYTHFWDTYSSHILLVLVSCLVLGLLLLLGKKTKQWSFILLTIFFVHIAASMITNIMKSEFKRARPEVYLNTKEHAKDFYNSQTKDYSFPSSHTSFYLSLFLPIALVFRKYAVLLMVLPGIIIMGRVVLNEHYLSDVLCSILLVYYLCHIAYSLLDKADKAMGSFVRKAIAKKGILPHL
jgi:membrane-associated phospholipid phosphatase